MSDEAIVVRKPALDFERPIQHFYMGGDPVKTQLFNALNLLFPDGERYFVKAVHDHAKYVSDPALLREMRAFAGQEGQHAHQHERFFAVMKQHGYRFGKFLRAFRDQVQFGSRRAPRALRLAITAGAEHYTATMAAAVLDSGLLEECDPTMRDLITWHAVEEIEHKHVAYDVLVKLYPRNYLLRIFGFLLATLSIVSSTAIAFRLLMRQDLAAGRVTREQIARGRAALKRGRELQFRRRLRRAIVRYFKPGFHPNQSDDRALLERFAPQIPQLTPNASAVAEA